MPCRIRHYATKETTKHWTKSSIECYNNGLMCSKCTLPDDIKTKCRMKGVVLDLVMKYGRPKGDK